MCVTGGGDWMMNWKGRVVFILYHKLVRYLFYCIVLSPPKESQNGKNRFPAGAGCFAPPSTPLPQGLALVPHGGRGGGEEAWRAL